MPPDNTSTIAPGADVDFPQDGVSFGTSITRLSSNAFNLEEIYIIETTVENSVLSVRNPSGNTTALTITPTAGGNASSSAHLIIMQL